MMTEEQKKQVQEAVKRAELKTSGEIVPVILARSDTYPAARWRVAVSVSLAVAFGVHWFRPELSASALLWLQFPALALGYALGGWNRIQRFFLSDAQMSEEVHQRALQAFQELGVTATRDRSGVLILISLLEHRVEVLADSGISSRLGPETWSRLVNQLVERIRAGALTEGLCEAVGEVGRLLAEHFPPRAEDRNELSDAVVFKKD